MRWGIKIYDQYDPKGRWRADAIYLDLNAAYQDVEWNREEDELGGFIAAYEVEELK